MSAGNKAVAPQKTKIRNDDKMLSFSLESHHHHNNRIPNRPPAMSGLTGRDKHINNRPMFIAPEIQKEKIFAFLIMLSLLIPPLLYVFVIPIDDNSSFNNDESNENPDMIVAPDNTIIFTAKESVKTRKNPKITGTRGYSGTSPPIGDWTITGDAVVWNETVTLNGNLTVTETGNLTLINVTLKVNCSYNGEFHIEVLGGGGLYIYDFDWDCSTINDASNITAVNTSNKYLFWVQKGSYFEMRNSKLSWCGYEWGTNGDLSGLWINTDYAVIEGNIISNMYSGPTFYEGGNNTIENNTIYGNSQNGIYLSYSSDNKISKNTIYNNKLSGIYLISSSNENKITENEVFDNTVHGVRVSDSSFNVFSKNYFYSNSYHGIGLVTGSCYNNMSSNTIYGNSRSGICLVSSSNNNISNNSIFNNSKGGSSDGGIHLISYSNENKITENEVFDNTVHGVRVSESSFNVFSKNYFYSNSYHGIGLVTGSCYNNMSSNTIYGNSRSGICLVSSSNNNISNNSIFNNSKDGFYDGGIYLISSSKNNMSKNMIYSNRWRGIYLTSSSNENNILENDIFDNSVHGIVLYNSMHNVLSGNAIYNNSDQGVAFVSSSNNILSNNTIYNNTQYGIYLQSSSSNNITGCNISANGYGGFYLFSSSSNNIIINSSISSPMGYDFRLTTNSHIKALNTSFNRTNIRFDDTSSTLTVQWYLHVKVTNIADVPIINATVRVRDNTNGTYDENFTTDLEGTVKWIVLTEYIQDSSMIIYFTPHNIRADFKEYVDYVVPAIWMNRSKTIIIKLKVPGNYTMLYPGWNLISFPYIQSNTSIEAVLQPIAGHYDAVQRYNSNDTLDPWKHYSISKPSHLNDLDELNNKMGFWIHITSPEGTSLLFDGTIPTSDQTITLHPGWNLVGYPSIVRRLRNDALNNLLYGNDIRIIYYYDAKTHSWDILEANETMQKGVGYWVYANSELTWIVNNTIPPVHNLNKDLFYFTIQEGIDDANKSDTLEISSGVFYKNIKINKSVILVGNGENNTIIVGGGNITSDYVFISSMGISNSSCAFNLDGVNEISISNVLIYNCTYGLNINNSTGINIEECKFMNCDYTINSSCAFSLDGVNEISISNVLIYNCTYGLNINNSTGINIEECKFMNCDYTINSSCAFNIDGVNEIDISKVLIYNYTYGLNINNSTGINIEECKFMNCNYTISSNNSSYITVVNSTIVDCSLLNFLLSNSNITVLNSTFNETKIQLFDANSNLIVQWFLHVLTRDQLGYPISGTAIEVKDNENGSFDEWYITGIDGFARWIIVTEYIHNLTGNITFTPHNVSATHLDFSFYNVPRDVVINKTTAIVIISINTVSPTSILNVNRNRYYLTIQEAINDANPYDTIRLSSGTYTEKLNINKPLTLVGEDKYSTIIDGREGICINITSDDVMLSDLKIQNCTYGIYLDSNKGVSISDAIISNNTYGIYCNSSSPIIDHCTIENNNYGIMGFNSSSVMISNCILQSEFLEFSISVSYFTTLNTHFNTTKVMFIDPSSNLTVKWYLHVHVKDANDFPIEGANVRIMDNENGTFDENFTTGSDGYARWIALTERIQNLSGNVSFNPYTINVSYYDPLEEWLTFPDNPRNITINGTLFEIRKEIFTSLEAIPEFSHILMPIVAIIASFVVFRKRQKKTIKP